MIKIFPAIDILNKKCVRLKKGNFEDQKIYSENPLEIAKKFENAGLEFLHIIDLDGAKQGKTINFDIIKNIISNTNLKIQIGGGIRDVDTAKIYLDIGVYRVILGSVAVQNPFMLLECLREFGSKKIVLGLDLNQEKVAISGWLENTNIFAKDFLEKFSGKNVLMTDISKDGMLQGPNFSLYQKYLQKFPNLNFIASGGVSTLDDIKKLLKLGISDIIVGKAIYEEKILLEDLKNL